MTESEQRLIDKLEAWAIATGNWIFHRDLIANVKIANRDDFEKVLKNKTNSE